MGLLRRPGARELTDKRGRKLTDLAPRRQPGGVLLVAGSLVSAPPWATLCMALGHDQDEAVLAGRTVSCADLAGRAIAPHALADALRRALLCDLQDSA